MIEWITGNIWNSTCQIIVVTVNCVGVMGAGIARQCKERYPATFEQYRLKCKNGEYKPGQPILTNVDRPLLLFPTKNHWRNPSEYGWIEQGLDRIAKNAHRFDSIAIPPLGCGHGGLDWDRVKLLIQGHLSPIGKRIEVYEPAQQRRERSYQSRTLRNDKSGIHSEILLKDLSIAVTGGRDYRDKDTVFKSLDHLHEKHGIAKLIHGGARGADTLSAQWAKSRNIKISLFLPEWDKHGKRAGILRNQVMLDQKPDAVVAFPGGRGTAHMVRSSKEQGFTVINAESLI